MLTPLDLEREFGLTEGNIFQGELSLEQLFFLRPVPGYAQFRTPIRNLYMCGSATHPGGGIMRAPSRTPGRAGDSQRYQRGGVAMAVRRDVVVIGGGHNGLVTAFFTGKGRVQAAGIGTARAGTAAPQSPRRFIRGFVARPWRMRPVRSYLRSSATCSSR